jgi:hypothetical protein
MFSNLQRDADALFVGLISIALVAMLVSTHATPALLSDISSGLSKLIKIVVDPLTAKGGDNARAPTSPDGAR